MGNYSQYDDPRWQQKRLETLTQRGWICETCLSEHRQDIPVQVHHKWYKLIEQDGKLTRSPVWDYDDSDLRVLCDPCHVQTEIALMEVRKAMGPFEHFDIAAFAQDFMDACDVIPPKMVLNRVLLTLGLIHEEGAKVA